MSATNLTEAPLPPSRIWVDPSLTGAISRIFQPGDIEYILLSAHNQEVERLREANRALRRTVRSWQQHAERVAKLLGCIAINSEIESTLRTVLRASSKGGEDGD